MKVDRNKLMLIMANACMNTSDLQCSSGLPRPTVNNVISGKSVRPATIGKIARALGVPVENLIDM